MIRGIGCDVVEVKRVADVLAKHGERFVDRLLTPNEKPLYEPHVACHLNIQLDFALLSENRVLCARG